MGDDPTAQHITEENNHNLVFLLYMDGCDICRLLPCGLSVLWLFFVYYLGRNYSRDKSMRTHIKKSFCTDALEKLVISSKAECC